jgi:hypothetical protein
VRTAHPVRNLAASVLAGSALVLTACSSSTGGASVSQQQVEKKLKSESEIASVKTEVGAGKFDKVVSCIAKTLKKDANGSDLDDYVHGKKTIDQVKGNKGAAKVDVTSCVKSAIGGS